MTTTTFITTTTTTSTTTTTTTSKITATTTESGGGGGGAAAASVAAAAAASEAEVAQVAAAAVAAAVAAAAAAVAAALPPILLLLACFIFRGIHTCGSSSRSRRRTRFLLQGAHEPAIQQREEACPPRQEGSTADAMRSRYRVPSSESGSLQSCEEDLPRAAPERERPSSRWAAARNAIDHAAIHDQKDKDDDHAAPSFEPARAASSWGAALREQQVAVSQMSPTIHIPVAAGGRLGPRAEVKRRPGRPPQTHTISDVEGPLLPHPAAGPALPDPASMNSRVAQALISCVLPNDKHAALYNQVLAEFTSSRRGDEDMLKIEHNFLNPNIKVPVGSLKIMEQVLGVPWRKIKHCLGVLSGGLLVMQRLLCRFMVASMASNVAARSGRTVECIEFFACRSYDETPLRGRVKADARGRPQDPRPVARSLRSRRGQPAAHPASVCVWSRDAEDVDAERDPCQQSEGVTKILQMDIHWAMIVKTDGVYSVLSSTMLSPVQCLQNTTAEVMKGAIDEQMDALPHDLLNNFKFKSHLVVTDEYAA